MEQPWNVDEFVEQIQAQQAYELPMDEGQYLGFLIPGERVVLRRIKKLIKPEAPELVSCSVKQLFQSS